MRRGVTRPQCNHPQDTDGEYTPQPRLAHVTPLRGHRRCAEPCTLPGWPYPQPLGLRRSTRVHGLVPDYRDCIDALRKYSTEVAVFLFVHTMDQVVGRDGAPLLERGSHELQAESRVVPVAVFGTSIHDGCVLGTPSAGKLSPACFSLSPSRSRSHLSTSCVPEDHRSNLQRATEPILFERTTFLVLVICLCHFHPSRRRPATNDMNSTRCEHMSEALKPHSCAHVREDFQALGIELPEFTAIPGSLGMTRNTHILVIVHDRCSTCDYGSRRVFSGTAG